jgi:glyoxylase-like metal-dependent hydrolase (beta-lactamase superfamily II)
MPFDSQEAAIKQIQRLGYRPEDLMHIILTHMHLDHSGGLPDFPLAKVHVYKKEYDVFINRKGFLSAAYIKRNIAHQPDFILYEDTNEKWFDFDAIRLIGFEPEMYFIPLLHHTLGLCGVAIKTDTGWHFHCANAAADFRKTNIPDWTVRLVLGPYMPRFRKFSAEHPEVQVTVSHMFREFFDKT